MIVGSSIHRMTYRAMRRMRDEDQYGPEAANRVRGRGPPTLQVFRAEGVVSPSGTPHLPDHVPRKFCEAFWMVWLSLGDC